MPVIRFRLFVTFIIPLLFALPGNGITAYSEIDKLAEKKYYLTRMLDSLDLQKQNLKRNGLPIVEIEQQQSALKDSLFLLRNSIRKAVTTSQTTSSRKPVKKKPMKGPDTLFDWIIFIVGTIAIFSGVMFIIGIIRPIINRYRYNRKNKPVEKSIISDSVILPPPPPAFPLYKKQEQLTSTAVPLYTKRGTDCHTRPEHPFHTTPIYSSLPPTPPESYLPTGISSNDPLHEKEILHDQNTFPIEKQIVEAAHEGLDIMAISRKYHLSCDHVALILKVAGYKKSNP